ncbi:MAG: hypothetical protein Unbinned3205contig1001_1 [Prokaryotic dsDNA virus sp.]|nr:MAG: hypothetical protein Unbinned3205contig1001_1 [Prokaryotic dsDNA virus sp.]|tara:strand:+ start:9937 stop:10185 length:249 start_codon:yes stop_codon:yes gene_type:complete
MDNINITLRKQKRKRIANIGKIDLKVINDYWLGSMQITPQSIELLPNKLYLGNKCLDWFDKIKLYHDNKMKEFNRLFKWQKK